METDGTRRYYAVSYCYGRGVWDDGALAGAIYSFPSVQQRDKWVRDRPTEYISQSGFREALYWGSDGHYLRPAIAKGQVIAIEDCDQTRNR